MKINWKVRIKNPAWWIGMLSVIISPALAYMGITAAELTTWSSVGNVITNIITNPYLLGSVLFALAGALGVNTDPTTAGVSDSERVLRGGDQY